MKFHLSTPNTALKMLRPRVAIPTLRRHLPDLSVAVADYTPQTDTLSVPALVAQVIKEVLRERPPTPPLATAPVEVMNYTPFIMEPAFSGADTELESSENRTIITPVSGGLQIKCDTILLPAQCPVPARLYLTGQEADLPIIGQRCTVDVFGPEGYTKQLALAKHDTSGALYLELQEKGAPWHVHHPTEAIRFHLDNFFALKSASG
jgi:hypothetical protein